ncbi:BppU family phage baseplate upper protein [Lactobacillus crispatus]|uniref:BppU family phage baseplate upper protein n=1 Tax=Lactobacillus crispatus TaxID=47770 RepID=UPI0018DE3E98|nr:BppU family phage baseplate upper protein [Lactobacillus crispatus]DAR79694.1 MAG TPA: tail protein [Caudoviricetes sp.]MBH9538920.1 BppU family phage baseplate upper protein [Lactobacillus crispatus]MBI1701889.1 phage capsid protein [Lactobacillus crispatus]MCT7888592.1 BppU family phage baseplate upper protein [Lactobacillus crispatus]MCZ3561154.1 BppU family phage baseplate upper protein [Lactobacillus crispatus]
MSLRPITLKTDKSITPVSDDTRVLRSTEKGLVLDVTILNEDDSPYDLTGKNVSFSEIKESDRVVADDGTGEQSGKFNMIDRTKGHFSYQMTHQCYTASGTCFFQIKQGDTIVDTTQDFYFQVKVDPTVKPINDSYVSSLIAMENHLLGATQKTQATIDQLNKDSSNAQQQAQAVLTKINSDFTDYSIKYNKLSSDWTAEAKSIQDAANQQLANLKTSNQADITAAVKSITDQRDAALKQLNDDKTKALADLQADYNAWKTSTAKDFNDTVQPLKDSISENDQKLTTVSKQVSDTVVSMDSLKQQFDKVDFSKFVTGDTIKNYYTKEETDLRLQQAGKVKSVDNIQPDSNGNINTDHYTKDQANQKLATKLSFVKSDSPQAAYKASLKPAADGSPVIAIYDMNDEPGEAVIAGQKITISTLNDAIKALQTQVSGLSNLQSLIDGKANSADVYLKTDIDNFKNQLESEISNAGKLKTITVNGGAKISPDDSGNANITVDLSSKVNQTDLNNTNNRVTAIETGYMKKPTVISKADYDKLATKDPNTLYEITE